MWIQSWSYGNVEYPFFTIDLQSTLAQMRSTDTDKSMHQVELFSLLLWIIFSRNLKPKRCVSWRNG